MATPSTLTRRALTAIALAAAAAVGLIAMMRVLRDAVPAGQPNPYAYDLAPYRHTPPERVGYVEEAPIAARVDGPAAIAVDASGRLYVGGEREVAVLDAQGTPIRRFAVDAPVRCLAADERLGLLAGMADHVEQFDTNGDCRAHWPDFGEKALLTSLAVVGDRVFAADYGQRTVWRCDGTGRLLGRIGAKSGAGDGPSFVLPSAYFDLAADAQGLWVANPGRQQVQGYTLDGAYTSCWGRASIDWDGFCGCCNPSHLALRPDGAFVTSEKGVPRVKVYRRDGTLDCIVAGPERFAADAAGLDVAVDRTGRILVLDPGRAAVRVFRPKPEGAERRGGGA